MTKLELVNYLVPFSSAFFCQWFFKENINQLNYGLAMIGLCVLSVEEKLCSIKTAVLLCIFLIVFLFAFKNTKHSRAKRFFLYIAFGLFLGFCALNIYKAKAVLNCIFLVYMANIFLFSLAEFFIKKMQSPHSKRDLFGVLFGFSFWGTVLMLPLLFCSFVKKVPDLFCIEFFCFGPLLGLGDLLIQFCIFESFNFNLSSLLPLRYSSLLFSFCADWFLFHKSDISLVSVFVMVFISFFSAFLEYKNQKCL